MLIEELGENVVLTVDPVELPRQAKVADLHRAVLGNEQVGRLDVAVHDSRRVNVLQAAEQIKKYGLDVALSQVELASVDLAQVCRHCFKHQVECLEVRRVRRLKDVEQLHDVAMALETPQKDHFTQLALRVSHVSEELIDFFNCHTLSGQFVDGEDNVSIAAGAYLFDKRVILSDVEFHFKPVGLGWTGHLQLGFSGLLGRVLVKLVACLVLGLLHLVVNEILLLTWIVA